MIGLGSMLIITSLLLQLFYNIASTYLFFQKFFIHKILCLHLFIPIISMDHPFFSRQFEISSLSIQNSILVLKFCCNIHSTSTYYLHDQSNRISFNNPPIFKNSTAISPIPNNRNIPHQMLFSSKTSVVF